MCGHGRDLDVNMTYEFGKTLPLEESRGVELKEVRGNNPVSSIVNTADEYAVAFLNAEGGRVLWGVRDSDGIIVGVPLDRQQRDRLRKSVTDKLHSIQPPIDPIQFELNLHPVKFIETPGSLYVAELIVPAGESAVPYYTGSNEMFVRLDGVKRKLTGPRLTAWIKSRSGRSPALARESSIPSVAALLTRVRQVFSEQGLKPGHLARFFALMNAPFDFRLDHYRTDAALLAWLDDEKSDWIAQTFGIRREWLDGEDEQVYQRYHFDKNPRHFWEVASPERATASGLMPEAYFIRWGTGGDWAKKGHSAVFVVLALPLCQLSTELIIYRYVSDFNPYAWDYPRCHIQMRAWARLLYGRGYIINGRQMTYNTGEKFESNSNFLRNFVNDGSLVKRLDWHPDDFALSDKESAVAKEADTLPHVLAFLSSHGLPTELRRDAKGVHQKPGIPAPHGPLVLH